MITIKLLLIEIGLVVITTVHNISADNRDILCEELINEVDIFDAGEYEGLTNFRNAFKKLRIVDIQNAVDDLPNNSGNTSMREKQLELTIAYSSCLFRGINVDPDFFDVDTWCRVTVRDYKALEIISLNASFEEKESIVGPQYRDEEHPNGKLGVLHILYENCSYASLKDLIDNHHSFNAYYFTLNYFNHVVKYVDDIRHTEDTNIVRFKSIKQFCIDEGYALL